jgi:hypothetical protein
MSETNIDNPLNARHDAEERNAPHVTRIPVVAEVDNLFDNSMEIAVEDRSRQTGTNPTECHDEEASRAAGRG